MTVKDLIKNLNNLIKEDPKYIDLPIIYSHDDEGNEFQTIENTPTKVVVNDINERYLEIIGFEGESDTDSKINALIIN